MKRASVWAAALILLLSGSAAVNAQGAAAPSADQHYATYKVGPGDILRITVFGFTAYDAVVQVGAGGTIPVHELGLVNVDGLSASAVAEKLATEFRNSKILRDPTVNVLVQEYRSHTVVMLGSLAKPGEYPLDRVGIKLTDLLARGGAQLGVGGGMVRITHADGQQTDYAVSALLAGEIDPPIQSGDTVVVKDAATFYISGEVQKAGSYAIEPGLTFGRAVALAGGVTARGARNRLKVTRMGGGGKEKAIKVKPEDSVLPRDLIVVGSRIF